MPKIVLGVGAASFSASFKGHVSGPTKSLTRHLALHFPVVLLDEFCTSKKCFHCKSEMFHPKPSEIKDHLKLTKAEKKALEMEQKQPPSSSSSSPLVNPFKPTTVIDKKASRIASRIYRCPTESCRDCNRDRGASMNIHRLFAHWLQGIPRPDYLTRPPAQAKSIATTQSNS